MILKIHKVFQVISFPRTTRTLLHHLRKEKLYTTPCKPCITQNLYKNLTMHQIENTWGF